MVKRGRANCFICKDKDATATGNTKNEMLARLRDFGIKVVELPDGNVKVFVEGKWHDYSTYLKFCNACGVKGPAMGELSESQLAAIKKAKREPLGVHALYQTPALPARPAHTWAPGSLPSAPKFEISVDVVATRARSRRPSPCHPSTRHLSTRRRRTRGSSSSAGHHPFSRSRSSRSTFLQMTLHRHQP